MIFKSRLPGVVTLAFIALLIIPLHGQRAGKSSGSCDKFIANLEGDGFEVHEGNAFHFDPIGQYCSGSGVLENALYANNGAPYAAGVVPYSPRGEAVRPFAPEFRLDPDEAVVLIGLTPPREKYFSYQVYLSHRYYPERNESLFLLNSIGDTVNMNTINTIGPDPFERPMVLIFTPDQDIDARVRAALRSAGYPAAILNTIVMPSATLKLGLDEGGDAFLVANRNAIFEDPEAGEEYVAQPSFRVFRVTPNEVSALNPFPTPPLRIRGTGQTEIDLTPTMTRLREAILDAYSGYTVTDYITSPIANEGFDYTQREVISLGDTRDAYYLGAGYMPDYGITDDLRLGDDDFLIAYGLNHVATGKATYTNINGYASETSKLALGSAFPADFEGSAYQYLASDDPAGDLTYAYKISRHCDVGEPFCLQLEVPDQCSAMEVLDSSTLLAIAFRLYLERATSVGPAGPEILYDRIIKFSPLALP